MAVQFSALRAEYMHLLNIAAPHDAATTARFFNSARRIIQYKDIYKKISERTGVPALWFMVINERESGTKFNSYLGNGDPLHKITTHVPKGRGPFNLWDDGAVDAVTYDHVALPGPEGWSWAWFLYKCEAWNGFGPRLHGKYTGFLWSGCQIYEDDPIHGGGKYTADGVWNPNVHDAQLGVFGLARALIQLDQSLNINERFIFDAPWGSPPARTPAAEFKPLPSEARLTGVRWLQDSLNKVQGSELKVDGSYGRHTRAAVRQFQASHKLAVDGQAGDLTCAAIDVELAKMPKSEARPTDQVAAEPPAKSPEVTVSSVETVRKPVAKGRTMDLTNLINLAGLVAPKFAPALASGNPFLPVAINVLGDALGLAGPHDADSVATGASEKPADLVAAAIKKASETYAAHLSSAAPAPTPVAAAPVSSPAAPAPKPEASPAPQTSGNLTGGLLVSQGVTGLTHLVTGAGTALLSSGLLDPTGPLSGMAKTYPILGLFLTIGGPLLNYIVVRASNQATEAVIDNVKK